MTKLTTDIQTVLLQLQKSIAKETWVSRRRYFNQLIAMANTMNITEPCQELYDAYIADDHSSAERRSRHKRCVRLLDKVAGTRSKDKNGRLYNPISLPGERETQEFFKDQTFPLCGEVSLDYLVTKAQMEMKYLGLTESTMGQYRHAWNEIRHYCLEHGTVFFDKPILDQFLSENEKRIHVGTIKEWKWKINRKAVFVLYEVAETGRFSWGQIPKQSTLLQTPEIEQIRLEYLASLECRNLEKSTVDLFSYVFRKMVIFSRIKTSEDLNRLKPDDLHGVISGFAAVCNSESMSTILPILRSILKELYSKGWIEKDISGAVIHGAHRKRSVSSYILPEDEELLIEQLNHESKRDKAIILLILRLGLRDCDITRLTFNEIDWMNDRIMITQKKTGKFLKLPLLPDVGNALLDYIKNERPRFENGYRTIFLREQAPHYKLSSVYPICSRLLLKLGITPVNGTKIGVHLFRYSLVHKMLKAKVPHQIITDTLGHVSKESDKPYLSMEESMLRQCALDLSVIGSISWEVNI
jgi:integrase